MPIPAPATNLIYAAIANMNAAINAQNGLGVGISVLFRNGHTSLGRRFNTKLLDGQYDAIMRSLVDARKAVGYNGAYYPNITASEVQYPWEQVPPAYRFMFPNVGRDPRVATYNAPGRVVNGVQLAAPDYLYPTGLVLFERKLEYRYGSAWYQAIALPTDFCVTRLEAAALNCDLANLPAIASNIRSLNAALTTMANEAKPLSPHWDTFDAATLVYWAGAFPGNNDNRIAVHERYVPANVVVESTF